MPRPDDAYAYCCEVTRRQARNFHYGIRLLPKEKRDALCAVYAFARRIDDIGDGDLPIGEKRAALGRARDLLHALATDPDPVAVALADAARRRPIPLDAFGELVDGVEMDLVARRYQTFDELRQYCRCVAGSIGRLSLGVFGSTDDERAPLLADALGVALQLTNILRDLREDATRGRVYLPADGLATLGLTAEDVLSLANGGPCNDRLVDALRQVVRAEADRAEGWYAAGMQLLDLLDHRSAACCAAMAGIYRRLLHRIAADPSQVLVGRVSLSSWQKASVAVRSLMGAAA